MSSFLIERAIKNTSVIGQAFFWSLKASLHSKASFERLYLILERFLMVCGNFKFRLYNQTLVNRALMDVADHIQTQYALTKGKTFIYDEQVKVMRSMLKEKEQEIKLRVYNVCTLSKYDERDAILYNVRGPNDIVQVFDVAAIEAKI